MFSKSGVILQRGLLGLLVAVFFSMGVYAQADKAFLKIDANEALINAQVIGLASLRVNEKGTGPTLVSGTIINNTTERLENLYLDLSISSGIVGAIVETTQKPNYPFSLGPGQIVYATNNDIEKERIPGIQEELRFDGGLTPEGENFIENLDGTNLPQDIYTVSVTLYQVDPNTGEKEILASDMLDLGGGTINDERNIYLKAPGDVVGTDASITNVNPHFDWEGDASFTYRLIVVRANGQDSPESLLEIAKSSPATQNGGSLLEFENLDTIVKGNAFLFPPFGAQALQPGQTYYWQVFYTVNSIAGDEEISSEIWSFQLSSLDNANDVIELTDEAKALLKNLLGAGELSNLLEKGYSLSSLNLDGQEIKGPAVLVKLEEMIRKIRSGEMVISAN